MIENNSGTFILSKFQRQLLIKRSFQKKLRQVLDMLSHAQLNDMPLRQAIVRLC